MRDAPARSSSWWRSRHQRSGHGEEGDARRATRERAGHCVRRDRQVFAAMSPVRTPSGIVAIARPSATTPRGSGVGADAFRPGCRRRAGSRQPRRPLRAAEAGGVTGALVCGASAHPFSWKALRGSMGSALRLPIASGSGRPRPAGWPSRAAGVRDRRRRAAGRARPGRTSTGRAASPSCIGGEGPGLRDAVVRSATSGSRSRWRRLSSR